MLSRRNFTHCRKFFPCKIRYVTCQFTFCLYISSDVGGASVLPTSESPTTTGGQEQGSVATAGGQEGQASENQEGEKNIEESTSVPQEQEEESMAVAAGSEQDTHEPGEGEGGKGEEKGDVAIEEVQVMDTVADTKTTFPEGKTCTIINRLINSEV